MFTPKLMLEKEANENRPIQWKSKEDMGSTDSIICPLQNKHNHVSLNFHLKKNPLITLNLPPLWGGQKFTPK
jgi:hypothetical protein